MAIFLRRSEACPLDLNNLPEEYGKQGAEESSTTTATSTHPTRFKKKRCDKERKDEGGNIYECRFCSLKFCKSQALGGHMNRHRQERETETLNRARQLVFSNDGFAPVGPHVGLRDLNFGGNGQAIPSFPRGGGVPESCLQFRPVYPVLRPPTGQLQQYIYSPQASPRTLSYAGGPFQLPTAPPPPAPGDYYLGRVLSGSRPSQPLGFGSAADAGRVQLVMEAPAPSTAAGRDGSGAGHGYGLHTSSYPSTDPF